jgi:hypothetical protein
MAGIADEVRGAIEMGCPKIYIAAYQEKVV